MARGRRSVTWNPSNASYRLGALSGPTTYRHSLRPENSNGVAGSEVRKRMLRGFSASAPRRVEITGTQCHTNRAAHLLVVRRSGIRDVNSIGVVIRADPCRFSA